MAGWKTAGLISLSKKYGLSGTYYDLTGMDEPDALAAFKNLLDAGPVILSVHNKFNPKSTVPHLVVINAMDDNVVYYNDPAAKTGDKQISITNFLKGWKERMIVVRPAGDTIGSILALNVGS